MADKEGQASLFGDAFLRPKAASPRHQAFILTACRKPMRDVCGSLITVELHSVRVCVACLSKLSGKTLVKSNKIRQFW